MLTRMKSNSEKVLMMDAIAEQYGCLTRMTDTTAEWYDRLTEMTGSLLSWISVESKEMRGRYLNLYKENDTEDEGALQSK